MRIVIIILGSVFIIIVADYFLQKITAPATCGLATAYILPDKCSGTCPPGSGCGATAVAPYGPGGLLGVQDSTCACVPILPPPPPPPPSGG